MRLFLVAAIAALLSFFGGLSSPWWWIFAPVVFLVSALLPQTLGRAWLAGFLGVFTLWLLLSLWIDSRNGSILSSKVAALFGLGAASWALTIITALVGAIVAGFAGMAGSALRRLPTKI